MEAERPKVVLIAPEIPGNTGTIGRTCVALNMELILIKPYGFEITDKSVRRAGLDYWKHVRLSEYDTWDQFLAARQPSLDAMYFFEEFGRQNVYEPAYTDDAWLIFGQETKGIPQAILEGNEERVVSLPMFSSHIRSLNLSNAVAAVAYQAMRDRLTKGVG